MSHIKHIIGLLNTCIQEKYVDRYVNIEFIPCTQNEMDLIGQCFHIYKLYHADSHNIAVLKAIIGYYYIVQVLDATDLDDKDNPSFIDFYANISCPFGIVDDSRKIVDVITKSENKYISDIRRKLLRMGPEEYPILPIPIPIENSIIEK